MCREPDHPDANHLLGIVYFQSGSPETALVQVRKALEKQPENAVFLHNLASVHKSIEQYEQAEECCRRALDHDPESAEGHRALGSVLELRGDLDGALEHLARAVDLKPAYTQAWLDLGFLRHRRREREDAVRSLSAGLELEPRHPRGNFGMSLALFELDRFEAARPFAERCCEIAPEEFHHHLVLGNICRALGDFARAEKSYLECIKLNPEHYRAHVNLASVYQDQFLLDQAESRFRDALALSEDEPLAYNGLGVVSQYRGEYARALELFDEALARKDDFAEARFNKGCVQLLHGDFAQGWPNYFWYRDLKPYRRNRLSEPYWDGSDLNGDKIYVQSIQGFGDSIHFIRYARLMAEKGGKVVFSCKPDLQRLMETADGVHEVISHRERFPPQAHRVPLFLVPRILETTLESIPTGIPYLGSDFSLAPEAAARIDEAAGLKVGLSWQGNPDHRHDHHRSLPLDMLAPLARRDDLQLFSLQIGPGSEQIDASGEKTILSLAPFIHDFADTAAIMSRLDLIIAIDSAPAHLAGALGREIWLMLPWTPEWRWMLDRTDSPWYPSMRLFRQPRPGDWAGVVSEIVAALDRRFS